MVRPVSWTGVAEVVRLIDENYVWMNMKFVSVSEEGAHCELKWMNSNRI